MPLSFIMGLSDTSTVRGLEWLCDRGVDTGVPILRPERLAYVGLRDVDVYERKILHRLRKEHGLFASTMQVVGRYSSSATVEEASRRFTNLIPIVLEFACARLTFFL